MSRIGNKTILVPQGVTVSVSDTNFVTVKGPKGELEYQYNQDLSIKLEGNEINISRPNNEIFMRKIHGTTRSLISNMITGVNEGFIKKLVIHGVGYRANLEGDKLNLSLGYSHPILLDLPEGINVVLPKNTEIHVEGYNKQVVGEFAAKIRSYRKPEPYLGKGIRYIDEYVPRKAGKTAK